MAKAAIHYLFIDGGCLRVTLEREVSKYIAADKCRFDLAHVAQGYTKIFLYDAIPAREQHETESDYKARIKPQQDMLDSAAFVHGVHVYEGTAHRRNRRLEQKKVDVMIAVDMLTHTFRRNMDYATLLTGDGDFHPLIDALVHEGMFVNLWYPPNHTNKDLLRAADNRRPITIDELFAFLEPEIRQTIRIPRAETLMLGVFEKRDRTTIDTWNEGKRWIESAFDGKCYLLHWAENAQHSIMLSDPDHKLLALYAKDKFGIHIPDFEPHPSWRPAF